MRVKVINLKHARQSVWHVAQPEFFDYQGDEVQIKWVSTSELALTTDIPGFPIRIIARNQIVEIDDRPYTFVQNTQLTKVVKGSKGEEYVVTLGTKPSCTCSGFSFRKSCRHVK